MPDTSFRLFVWQRATAAAMVPFIAAHLGVIWYATSHKLTASDILARTSGSKLWAAFYGLFVVLAAIHAAIGARTVLADWSRASEKMRQVAMWAVGLTLLVLGLRAVAAVVMPGAF